MDQLLTSPSYVTWLLGQSVAVVLLVLWVISLHRMLKRSSETMRDLQTKNEQLSASLVAIMQSNLHERTVSLESSMKTMLDAFENALQNKLDG